MSRVGRGGVAGSDVVVWLLGNAHPNADQSLEWDEDFGNLSDADVLIVDLTTLTEYTLQRIDRAMLGRVQSSIRDKLLYKGTTVVITQPEFSTRPVGDDSRDSCTYSNYHILPVSVNTRKVPTGFKVRARSDHVFRDYIDAVESFDFLLDVGGGKLPPGPTGAPQSELARPQEWDITDNSGHHIGLSLIAAGRDPFGRLQGVPGSGLLVFLPPPTEPICDAIGRILSVYRGAPPPAGAPPAWAEQIPFEGPDHVQSRIEQLEGQKAAIDEQIAELNQQKNEIMDHRRLLYAKGPDLEDAVGLAFKALGFAEITRRGGRDAADWIFDASTNGCQRVVVEVKGADKRTKHRHIVQCNKWADDLAGRTGESVKGVLVANQYCTSEYPGSIEDRTFFEANELDYALRKDVCIIPSCDLYEAVKKVLDGAAPDRDETERKITGAKGVLRDVL